MNTYKCNVTNVKYSTRTDYTDSTEDAEEYDIAYVADFRVSGNFSFKLPVRNKETGLRIEKTITEQNVMITFPDNAIRKKQGVSTCKVGTIANINCADEIRIFTQKCQGRDAYIDNRKSC